jgi:radical SAM protein with 4Fe4S-binding SPASM domain
MEVSLAKQLIKEYFDMLPVNNVLKIEIRGGEPLLEFDFIKEICEWTFSNYVTENYFFYAVTNGTFLKNEYKIWFSKHKDKIRLPLSIDGAKETQDFNRDNSYDKIDINFFLNNWENAYTYTTILPENSKSIYENLLFLTLKGFTVRANFEFTQTWSDCAVTTCSYQLRELVDTIISKQIKQKLNILSCYSFIDFEEKPTEDRRYILNCNAGHRRFIYTPDGKKYPCHTLVPSVFNHYGINDLEVFRRLSSDVLNPPECCECSYFYLCYICVGFSLSYANDYQWRNKSFCDITRIRTFASAYYWGKKLFEKSLKGTLSPDEEYIANKIYKLYKAEDIV